MSEAANKIRAWREDPVRFVYDNFKTEPDAWQLKVLKAFPSQDETQKRISLQACAGPGKSAVLAWCGWNFLTCYGEPNEHPKGAAVSITQDNLRDNLWAEFSKWQGRSPFLKNAFTWTGERIFAKDHPETWFISARSFPKRANPEQMGQTLSGLHSKYVLYLIDESGGIHPAVLRAAEQGLSTGAWGKIMQAGNPISLDGMLYLAAQSQRGIWFIVRITGDPDDIERSPRVDKVWAQGQIDLYGRDNPWVMAYILGKFPPGSLNSLLTVDDVEDAMARTLREEQYRFAQKRIGVDVARFGDDRTVLFGRQGLVARYPVIMRNASTDKIAARVAQAKLNFRSELEFVDDTGGYGGGVIDFLNVAGYTPIPVNAGSKAIDPRFENKRAEMWWLMAEWVKRGGCLPKIPELVPELTSPTYTFTNKGKIIIEPKDLVKKRIGKSPDLADGLGFTFALPEMPASQLDGIPMALVPGMREGREGLQMKTDFEPNHFPEPQD